MIHAEPGFRILAASAHATEALGKVSEAKPDLVLRGAVPSALEKLALRSRLGVAAVFHSEAGARPA